MDLQDTAVEQNTSGDQHPRWEIQSEHGEIPSGEPSSGLVALKQAVEAAEVDWTVGSLDGAPATVFGNPVDVAWDGHRLFVLDAMFNEVRVFDEGGQFQWQFGREGSGPGEFQFPLDIELLESERLLVSTASSVKLFRIDEAEVEHQQTLAVSESMPSPWDVCAHGEVIYLSSPNLLLASRLRDEGGRLSMDPNSDDGGPIVVAMDAAGQRLHSFGAGYRFGSLLLQSEISQALLACGREPAIVLVAIRYLPFVEAYSTSGQLVWTSYVSDFDALAWDVGRQAGRSTVSRDRTQPGDLLLSLTTLPEGAAIVQVARLAPGNAEGAQRISRLDSYVISLTTGEGVPLDRELPRILHADDGKLWGVESDSAGVLSLLQLRYTFSSEVGL